VWLCLSLLRKSDSIQIVLSFLSLVAFIKLCNMPLEQSGSISPGRFILQSKLLTELMQLCY